jgi:hypothetical protein
LAGAGSLILKLFSTSANFNECSIEAFAFPAPDPVRGGLKGRIPTDLLGAGRFSVKRRRFARKPGRIWRKTCLHGDWIAARAAWP